MQTEIIFAKENQSTFCANKNNCFPILIELVTRRDCFEFLSDDEQENCFANKLCARCTSDLCNVGHPLHTCLQCNSTADETCGTAPTSLNATQCGVTALESFGCYARRVCTEKQIIPLWKCF